MTEPTKAALPTTMRAAQWTTTRPGGLAPNLKHTTTAALPPNAHRLPRGSTLVRVAYTTPNPVDYKIPEVPLAPTLLFTRPATPGLDYSGTVVESTLPHLGPGDRVFGAVSPPVFGAFAEFLVVGSDGCVPVPAGVSLRDAATVGVAGLTALQTLVPHLPADPTGCKVFVNGGSGGTGTWLIQIARALGCRVVVACSGKNAETCLALGAEMVVDYRSEDVVKWLRGRGWVFDVIVDVVNAGATEMYWQAHHYLKEGGKYVCIAGSPSVSGVWGLVKMFCWPRVLGGGKRDAVFVMMVPRAKEYARIAEWMREGKVKPSIEEEFGLEEAGRAMERMKTGRTRGKMVIRVAGEE